MLMPTLSVSVIGLAGALVAMTVGRHRLGPAVGRGLLGAWLGFVAGALAGVLVDVVAASGVWLAYLGHLGAVLGTVVVLRARDPLTSVALRYRPVRGR